VVAEKYAVPDDLGEIIGRYQQEKESGHHADPIGFPGSDI
jgi:hypothetical protein